MTRLNTERYYLRDTTGRTVKFLHIQQANPNTIHIYLPGIDSKQSRVVKKYPSRVVSEITKLSYNWKDFEVVDEQSPINYISFHPIEMCFRFQLVNGKSFDVKHDESNDLGGYIDFIIHSASVKDYVLPSQPKSKNKHTVIDITESQIARLHGSFAVGSGDLRDHPVFGEYAYAEGKGTLLPVKMAAIGTLLGLSEEAKASKPEGIIFSALLFLKNGSYRAESYLLE